MIDEWNLKSRIDHIESQLVTIRKILEIIIHESGRKETIDNKMLDEGLLKRIKKEK